MLRERIPVPVEEAIERILAHVNRLEVESVPLEEAYGRILAEPLIADHAVPPFDRAMMDGYAIRSHDTIGARPNNPVKLEVIETIAAGNIAKHSVESGQAIRIMTGAAIPTGATGVVMFEKTNEVDQDSPPAIYVLSEVAVGENIAITGEDIGMGEVVLKPGSQIGPGEVSLLATFGYSEVKVFRKPVVGICATGSELLPVHSPLEPGKIRNSNSYMLVAQVKRLGGIPKNFGIVPDQIDEAIEKITAILSEVDILITSGGVSVGDYDLMYDVFQGIGAKVLFDKLLMRPGKPTTVAKLGNKLIFGLSGNPGACFVGFELFVRPTLFRMADVPLNRAKLPQYKAIFDVDFRKPSAYPRYIRAYYYVDGQQLRVTPAGPDKSGLTRTIQQANCLAFIPAGGQGIAAGTEVTIYTFGEAGQKK